MEARLYGTGGVLPPDGSGSMGQVATGECRSMDAPPKPELFKIHPLQGLKRHQFIATLPAYCTRDSVTKLGARSESRMVVQLRSLGIVSIGKKVSCINDTAWSGL